MQDAEPAAEWRSSDPRITSLGASVITFVKDHRTRLLDELCPRREGAGTSVENLLISTSTLVRRAAPEFAASGFLSLLDKQLDSEERRSVLERYALNSEDGGDLRCSLCMESICGGAVNEQEASRLIKVHLLQTHVEPAISGAPRLPAPEPVPRWQGKVWRYAVLEDSQYVCLPCRWEAKNETCWSYPEIFCAEVEAEAALHEHLQCAHISPHLPAPRAPPGRKPKVSLSSHSTPSGKARGRPRKEHAGAGAGAGSGHAAAKEEEEEEAEVVKAAASPSPSRTSYGLYGFCMGCDDGDNEDYMLLCDECDDPYHTFCLPKKLEAIPTGNWSCPHCDPTNFQGLSSQRGVPSSSELIKKLRARGQCTRCREFLGRGRALRVSLREHKPVCPGRVVDAEAEVEAEANEDDEEEESEEAPPKKAQKLAPPKRAAEPPRPPQSPPKPAPRPKPKPRSSSGTVALPSSSSSAVAEGGTAEAKKKDKEKDKDKNKDKEKDKEKEKKKETVVNIAKPDKPDKAKQLKEQEQLQVGQDVMIIDSKGRGDFPAKIIKIRLPAASGGKSGPPERKLAASESPSKIMRQGVARGGAAAKLYETLTASSSNTSSSGPTSSQSQSQAEPEYLIHFLGWGSKYDEWVGVDRIVGQTPLVSTKAAGAKDKDKDKVKDKVKEKDRAKDKEKMETEGNGKGKSRGQPQLNSVKVSVSSAAGQSKSKAPAPAAGSAPKRPRPAASASASGAKGAKGEAGAGPAKKKPKSKPKEEEDEEEEEEEEEVEEEALAFRAGADGKLDEACVVCRSAKHDEKMLLCDWCDDAYHTFCCSPPLTRVPDGDWLCRKCSVPATKPSWAELQKKYLDNMQCIHCRRKFSQKRLLRKHKRRSDKCREEEER